jgi:AcrR family transcriptional regulator
MTEETASPQPERLLLSTRREYLEALDRLTELARRELRIFDADFSELKIDSPQTHERLRAFLLDGRDNRLYIAVHDTDYIRDHCPRLLDLLQQFSDRMFIRQTEGDAARAQDSFVLADKRHCLRRPVQAQPRATLKLNDEHESQGMYLRFSEIWDSSVPAVSATTSGL